MMMAGPSQGFRVPDIPLLREGVVGKNKKQASLQAVNFEFVSGMVQIKMCVYNDYYNNCMSVTMATITLHITF